MKRLWYSQGTDVLCKKQFIVFRLHNMKYTDKRALAEKYLITAKVS